MPTESAFLLAGLLFIAAGLGYVFAKYGDTEDDRASSGRLSEDYLKGVNFLLNEEPDRAVEVFTRMAEFDDETLETHLALGSLFRKRGEVDRAIKVHQNVLARPTLSRQQKHQAQMALADDYLSAGLLDRAESLFMEMRESPEYRWQALKRLIRIFELTKEWEQAIDSYQELESLKVNTTETNRVAHYYCELAEQARNSNDYTTAREMLKKAEASRQGTVRSKLIRGDIARDLDDHKTAVKLYEEVAWDEPDLLVEVIPRLAASCRAADMEETLGQFLSAAMDRLDNAVSAIAVAAILDDALNDPVALDALQQYIIDDETLGSLVDSRRLVSVGEVERMQRLGRVRAALRGILSRGNRYRCRKCGYATLIIQWQCPSCSRWGSVKPETRIQLASAQ
jgi:lipopolysaccharide biosynthesis regulator YciM